MAGHPNICVRVDGGDVVIEVLHGIIVMILSLQSLDQARRVAGVRRSLAIADLEPKERASLAATAAEEEVVIDFVVRRSICAVKNSHS